MKCQLIFDFTQENSATNLREIRSEKAGFALNRKIQCEKTRQITDSYSTIWRMCANSIKKCLNSPTFDFKISLGAVFWRENVRYLTVLIRFLGKVLLYGSRQICPSSQHGHLGTAHIWLPWKCCNENWRKTRKIVCHCRY